MTAYHGVPATTADGKVLSLQPPLSRCELVSLISSTRIQVIGMVDMSVQPALAETLLNVLELAGVVPVPSSPTEQQIKAGVRAALMHEAMPGAVAAIYEAMTRYSPLLLQKQEDQ